MRQLCQQGFLGLGRFDFSSGRIFLFQLRKCCKLGKCIIQLGQLHQSIEFALFQFFYVKFCLCFEFLTDRQKAESNLFLFVATNTFLDLRLRNWNPVIAFELSDANGALL